ncbi:hypothetical protein [Paraburkholderia aromaticivorans]|uniref:hypothetical protein n=1 Tax=Paraburkholderia aromaticivorans TaxID=2026199 RepID=UPI001455FEFC|nr:hypothetical protein [Paraburkholderia aromaticivorans]
MSSAKAVRNPIVLGYHAVVRTIVWLLLVDFSLMAVSKTPVLQTLVFLGWVLFFYFRVLSPFIRFMLPPKPQQKQGQGTAKKSEIDTAAPKAQQAAQAAVPEAQPQAAPSPKRKYAKTAVVTPSSMKS